VGQVLEAAEARRVAEKKRAIARMRGSNYWIFFGTG